VEAKDSSESSDSSSSIADANDSRTIILQKMTQSQIGLSTLQTQKSNTIGGATLSKQDTSPLTKLRKTASMPKTSKNGDKDGEANADHPEEIDIMNEGQADAATKLSAAELLPDKIDQEEIEAA